MENLDGLYGHPVSESAIGNNLDALLKARSPPGNHPSADAALMEQELTNSSKAKAKTSPKRKRQATPKSVSRTKKLNDGAVQSASQTAKAKPKAKSKALSNCPATANRTDAEVQEIKMTQALAPLVWPELDASRLSESPFWLSGSRFKTSSGFEGTQGPGQKYNLDRYRNVEGMTSETWSKLHIVYDFLQLSRPLLLSPNADAEDAINSVVQESLGFDVTLQSLRLTKLKREKNAPSVLSRPVHAKSTAAEKRNEAAPPKELITHFETEHPTHLPSILVPELASDHTMINGLVPPKYQGLVPLFDEPPSCPALDHHLQPESGPIPQYDASGSCLYNQLRHSITKSTLHIGLQDPEVQFEKNEPLQYLGLKRDMEQETLGIATIEQFTELLIETLPNEEEGETNALLDELEAEGASFFYGAPERSEEVAATSAPKEASISQSAKWNRLHLLLVRLIYMSDLIKDQQFIRSQQSQQAAGGVNNAKPEPGVKQNNNTAIKTEVDETPDPAPSSEAVSDGLIGLEDAFACSSTIVENPKDENIKDETETEAGDNETDSPGGAPAVKISKAKETAALAAAKIQEIFDDARTDMLTAPLTPMTWPEFCIGYLRKHSESLEDIASLPMKLKRGTRSYETELVYREAIQLDHLANTLETQGYMGLKVDMRMALLEFLVRRVADTPMFRAYVEKLIDRSQRFEKSMLGERRIYDKACETRIRAILKTLQDAFDSTHDLQKRYDAMGVPIAPELLLCLSKLEEFGLTYPLSDTKLLQDKEDEFQSVYGSPHDQYHEDNDANSAKIRRGNVSPPKGSGKGKAMALRIHENTSPKEAYNTMERMLSQPKFKLIFSVDEFRNLPMAQEPEFVKLLEEIDVLKTTQLAAWHRHEVVSPALKYMMHFMSPRRTHIGMDRSGHLYWHQRGASFNLEVEAPIAAVHSLRQPFDRSSGITTCSGSSAERIQRQKLKELLLEGITDMDDELVDDIMKPLSRPDAYKVFDGTMSVESMLKHPVDFPTDFPVIHPPKVHQLSNETREALRGSGIQSHIGVDGMAAMTLAFCAARGITTPAEASRKDLTHLAQFMENLGGLSGRSFEEEFPDLLPTGIFEPKAKSITPCLHSGQVDPQLEDLSPVTNGEGSSSGLFQIMHQLHLSHDPTSGYPSGPSVDRPALWQSLQALQGLMDPDQIQKGLHIAKTAGTSKQTSHGLPYRYGVGDIEHGSIPLLSFPTDIVPPVPSPERLLPSSNEWGETTEPEEYQPEPSNEKRLRSVPATAVVSKEERAVKKQRRGGLLDQEISVPSQLVAAMNVGGGPEGRRARAARREAITGPNPNQEPNAAMSVLPSATVKEGLYLDGDDTKFELEE